ncbi:MAG: hypothetical protein II088_03050, partial [Bacteroidales bacterium]|nr:hypothetical protein [Bacteroidales bacterium]
GKEYAEYRRLFDARSRSGLSEAGIARLNELSQKEGAIGRVEAANQKVFKVLAAMSTSEEDKHKEEHNEQYRQAQEEYNSEKKKHDKLYEDAIKEFDVPEKAKRKTYVGILGRRQIGRKLREFLFDCN